MNRRKLTQPATTRKDGQMKKVLLATATLTLLSGAAVFAMIALSTAGFPGIATALMLGLGVAYILPHDHVDKGSLTSTSSNTKPTCREADPGGIKRIDNRIGTIWVGLCDWARSYFDIGRNSHVAGNFAAGA
tara:strand:+ start:2218 stop:2613 length:396 start_codon:yes stop_codon:yes gene_type:complete